MTTKTVKVKVIRRPAPTLGEFKITIPPVPEIIMPKILPVSLADPVQKPRKTGKVKQSAILAAQGRRFYSFAWPVELMAQVIPLAEAQGLKPNDYLQAVIEKHLEGASV